MNLIILRWFLLLTGLLATGREAQHPKNIRPDEQSDFSMGQEIAPIERPVSVAKGVLQILRKNEYVLGCLKEGQSPNEIPASWFVGSEIHLDGPEGIDLVVQPRSLPEVPAPNRCLVGANIGAFWVFRGTRRGYELVLDVSVHDLKVLNTKSRGYRDIQTWSATAVTHTTLLFKFDGRHYKLHKKKTMPI